jgi:transposase-like protein
MSCPYCEGNNIISLGARRKCKDCHKTFAKNPRREKVSIEDRPTCPECGAGSPYLQGHYKDKRRYTCKECGRVYIERPLPNNVAEVIELEVQVE